MLYKAWYKKPGGIFWHKVKKVEGDTIIETKNGNPLPVRVLFLSDKSRIEIPMSSIIKFSKGRFYDIEANMETETGQKIRTKEKIN